MKLKMRDGFQWNGATILRVRGMPSQCLMKSKRFADINDLWNKLDKINFYFRDIEEMKLTDDISHQDELPWKTTH